MKRFLSILLVAMLIVTSLATVAFAADSAKVSVSGIENAVPGNEYTVTFTVTGEFANYELYVKSDSALKLTKISGVVNNVKTGKVAYATDENIDSQSFTATFKLDANAKCGTYEVSAKVLFVSDRNLVDQNVTVEAGTITVNHKWDDGKVTTNPTCEGTGVKTYTCSICGGTKTDTINALDHTAGDWTTSKEATCTEAGEKVQKCTVCGKVLQTKAIAALGHDHKGEVTKDATCTEAGEMTYKCSRCSDSYTKTIAALGHDYEVKTTTATCTEGGITTYVCSRCGDSYTDGATPALGHDYKGEVTKAATCTEAGEMTYKCSRCGDTYTDIIAANGHVWCEDFDCAYEHDHFDEDYHWFLCQVCGEKKDVERHDHSIENNGYLFCKCGHWIEIDDPEIDPQPKPGDLGLMIAAGSAALIAMMAAAAYIFKRKFAK